MSKATSEEGQLNQLNQFYYPSCMPKYECFCNWSSSSIRSSAIHWTLSSRKKSMMETSPLRATPILMAASSWAWVCRPSSAATGL